MFEHILVWHLMYASLACVDDVAGSDDVIQSVNVLSVPSHWNKDW